MHLGLQYQALGVHQQLSLPTADLLTTVVSSRFSAHPGSLCGLRVHYPGTGFPYSLALRWGGAQSKRCTPCHVTDAAYRSTRGERIPQMAYFFIAHMG